MGGRAIGARIQHVSNNAQYHHKNYFLLSIRNAAQSCALRPFISRISANCPAAAVLCQAHYLVYHLLHLYVPGVALFVWSWLTMLKSAKSKLVYKPKRPKSDDKERLKLAFSNAISALKTSLQIIKGVTGGVGLGSPGLQTGLSALLLVLDAIQVSL